MGASMNIKAKSIRILVAFIRGLLENMEYSNLIHTKACTTTAIITICM